VQGQTQALNLEANAVKTPTLLLVCCFLLFSTSPKKAHAAANPADNPFVPVNPHTTTGSEFEDFDCASGSCESVLRGLRGFFDRKLVGLDANGRSCADCHIAKDHFQLSPADVEARYQALQARRLRRPRADDPLFRAIDADDFRTNGESASDFSNLRQNGLIRITFQLPPNMKLVDPATNQPSSETSVDVWRSVPSVNNVALTGPDGVNPWRRGPNPSGGYQLDARVATLQEQALGALTNHAQTHQAPSPTFLDDLSAFQMELFTNHRVRELAQAVRRGTSPLPDADPPVSTLEQQGKVVFERACSQCHGGPGQSTPQAPVVRYHDIASQCPRPVDPAPSRFAFAPCPPRLARNARTYQITLTDGSTIRRTSSDPGRALLTGFVGGAGILPAQDDWNKLDIPGLRGISKTAPYFHNNSAATLEEVVDHYIEFFKRVQANAPPGVVPPAASTDGVNFDRRPTLEEREALLAYLRTL
jgi:cytochrome c peroxidase